MGDDKLNIKEISDYLECSEYAINYLIKAKQIPYDIISSKVIFDKNIIDRWIYDNQISKIEVIDNRVIVYTYNIIP